MKKITTAFFALVILLVGGCTDNMVFDQNVSMPKEGWYYKNPAKFDIELTDASHYYNFFINLRITPDYEYSNMYVLLHAKSPGSDSMVTRRIDLTLAEPDGRWLGKGTASIISYRIPIVSKFVLPKTGIYHFEIEQNMRTNTLKEVLDVGMAVEMGDVVF